MTKETSILAAKLHVTNGRIYMLENEASQKSSSLNASLERLQKADNFLREKEQQNIYHFDQIELLKRQVVEMENVIKERDLIHNNHAKEIFGLKNHLSEQAKYVKQLERETERLRKSKRNIRMTPELSTEEDRKVEFGDLK